MKVEFLKKFSKDLDDVQTRSVKQTLLRVIESMEETDTLDKILNTKN